MDQILGIITKKCIYSSVIEYVTTDVVVIDTRDIISNRAELLGERCKEYTSGKSLE
jgi:hypothetical protein